VFAKAPSEATWGAEKFTLLSGRTILEVVGESHYQDVLVTLAGDGGSGVRATVTALLIPETDNPYDENAISVAVQGQRVGRLSREMAADLRSRIVQPSRQDTLGIGEASYYSPSVLCKLGMYLRATAKPCPQPWQTWIG
jgi:hypothetical protein